jgi:hypothetical protein
MLSVLNLFPFSLQTIFSTLKSFITNVPLFLYHSMSVLLIHFQPKLSISTHHQHHIMIGTFLPFAFGPPLHFLMFKLVTILILEHACLLYASPSRPSLQRALVNSISRYQASDTHSAVMRQFTAPQENSVSQFTEFILQHRL